MFRIANPSTGSKQRGMKVGTQHDIELYRRRSSGRPYGYEYSLPGWSLPQRPFPSSGLHSP
eukprot:scaffold194224_cov47-Prasinocladus_malaysianus.AAC.2